MSTDDSTLVELAERPAAVLRAHVPTEGIAAFIGRAFGEVMQAVHRSGSEPAGTPFARYRVTSDGFDVEAGFPVSGDVAGDGVEHVILPGGPAVRVLHRGSYAEVGAAYEAGLRWMAEHGYEPSSDPWECYLDEPDVPAPRTEVLMPCRQSRTGT